VLPLFATSIRAPQIQLIIVPIVRVTKLNTYSIVYFLTENVGVAFGIPLLSSAQAKIVRNFKFTSGSGGHLLFTIHPDVRECSH